MTELLFFRSRTNFNCSGANLDSVTAFRRHNKTTTSFTRHTSNHILWFLWLCRVEHGTCGRRGQIPKNIMRLSASLNPGAVSIVGDFFQIQQTDCRPRLPNKFPVHSNEFGWRQRRRWNMINCLQLGTSTCSPQHLLPHHLNDEDFM